MSRQKITPEIQHLILAARARGEQGPTIARVLGISSASVYQVIWGRWEPRDRTARKPCATPGCGETVNRAAHCHNCRTRERRRAKPAEQCREGGCSRPRVEDRALCKRHLEVAAKRARARRQRTGTR
jgi:hypothetical protein